MKKIIALASLLAFTSISQAASIDVKCDTRSRSSASVDGKLYPNALYRARLQSGLKVVWSRAFQRPLLSELEFDFSSKQNDVIAGATALPINFIVNKAVRGSIYRYNTTTKRYTLVTSAPAFCR